MAEAPRIAFTVVSGVVNVAAGRLLAAGDSDHLVQDALGRIASEVASADGQRDDADGRLRAEPATPSIERQRKRALDLEAAVSDHIAANDAVADVLAGISQLLELDDPHRRVGFAFTHPDFTFRTRDYRARAARQIPVVVERATVGAITMRARSGTPTGRASNARRVVRATQLTALLAQREIGKHRLVQRALHDPLTGLVNRTLLNRSITLALSDTGAQVSLLVIGIDRFKLLTGGFGHHVGDAVLKELAARFATCLGRQDTLARFGGDELAILVRGTASHRDTARLGERLLEQAQEPMSIEGHELRVSVCVGIADPGESRSAPDLVASADSALAEAKRSGRNRVVRGDLETRARVENRLALEQVLRAGIPHTELRGYLQPVVNLAVGTVVGAEVLVRWEHPTRGLLRPADFMPWAEETDVMEAVGTAMLDAACRDVVALGRPSELTVSVCVSAGELADPAFAERTLATLRRHRLSPRSLAIELTESALVSDVERVRPNLSLLRAAGVSIYLDDLGTAFCSLSDLRQLPVDAVKIDGSLIAAMTSDPTSAKVVAAIVALATALSLSTIAEGVETAEQCEALTALGVVMGHGYLYARPRSIGGFAAWLVTHPIAPGTAPPQSAGERAETGRAADVLDRRLPRAAGDGSDLAVGHLLAIAEGTRALVHATTVEEIVETCCSTVRRLGGTVLPARLAGNDAIPLDLSFGQGEPLLAIAPDRCVRQSLEAVLTDLMEDARATAVRVRRAGILNDEAAVDGLTGLLNRRSIDRLLAHVRQGDVVIMMDLDDFKTINDTLGHAAGDVVLTAFARLLRQEGRTTDRLGRLGGDEFVVVIPGGNMHEATTLLGRLRDAWKAVRPHPVGFSAGVAVATGSDPHEVVARADEALYRDKARPGRRTRSRDRGGAETA